MQYLKMLELKGRGFVVLGAGQGIGAAAAQALAQAGATVLCVDNDKGRAEAIAREVKGHACCADVLKRADVERIFREAQARLSAVTASSTSSASLASSHWPPSTMPPGMSSSTRSCGTRS